ncbi:chromatin modification-related protein eaf-1, partial [Podospora aff. communis PSN243]
MTEVGPADHANLLSAKRDELSSIVRSRKRKLRELYAIATVEDAIPSFDFCDPDAPPTTPAEQKFLDDTDLSRGRTFDDSLLPPYRSIPLDAVRQRIANAKLRSNKPVRDATYKHTVENGHVTPVPSATTGLQHLGIDLPLTNGIPRQYATSQGTRTSPQPLKGHAAQTDARPVEAIVGDDGVQTPARKGSVGLAPVDVQQHSVVNGALLGSENTKQGLAADQATTSPADVGSSGTPTNPEHDPRDLSPGRPNGILTELKTDEAVHDGQPSQADPSRYADALSSPGSTVQSTLTTTIHDGSADTSPDHEGPQYPGKGEDGINEKLENDRAVGHGDREDAVGSAAEAPAEPKSPAAPAVSGVEAQLLQESAAAQLSQAQVPVDPSGAQASTEGTSQPSEGSRDNVMAPTNDAVVEKEDVDMVGEEPEATTKPSDTNIPTPDNDVQGVSEPMDIDGEQVTTATEDGPKTPTQSFSSTLPKASAQETSALVTPATRDKPLAERPNPTVIVTDDTQNPPQQDPATGPTPLATSSPSKSPLPLLEHRAEETDASRALSAPQLKLLANKARDRRRRSVPTVIFGKQAKKPRVSDDSALVVSRQQPGHIPTDDYFTPLFIEGFTRQSLWMKPIEKLLNQAHKTLSTSDQYVSILDHQACKILRRVYHLQQHDKWSLRQPVRCPEPVRPPSHWDVLLQEMKWMRTDFREEHKWKRAIARNMAVACAEWVQSSPTERLALQVNAVVPPKPQASTSKVSANTIDPSVLVDSPPELVHSDSPLEDSGIDHDEEPLEGLIEAIAPATIFALQDDEVVFSLQPSKTADELLANLPLYGSPLAVPKFNFSGAEYDPDARWRRPALPLSKYVEGEMVLASQPPPRKRSRFRHRTDSEDEDDEVIFGAKPDDGSQAQPATIDVALFNPEMRQTRERLHASHQFRPPTEHIMPPQSFYECRIASQWTQAEDDQLRSLVREYSYNWSLISTIVSPRTLFPSGAERRTPWECFERWVHLEGLPSDFGKSPYFKVYQGRIDAAQKVIVEHNQKAQQVAPNGTVTPVPRKRPTTTVRVERRRNQKHLALIDAMRKQAKKRESNAHKALQAANLRKNNEAQAPAARPQAANKTPRDYSLMRWERDQQLAERMAQYARRTELQKRASRVQQVPHAGQVPATPGGVPNPQAAAAAAAAAQLAAANALNAAARANIPAQLGLPGQARPAARLPMQTPAGASPAAAQAAQVAQVAQLAGGGLVPPHPMASLPQAHLQAAMQAQQHRLPVGTPQPDIGNLVLQARRIQDQQRAAVQQLQQQQQQQQQQHAQQLQQQHQPQQVVQQLQHQQGIQQPQQ